MGWAVDSISNVPNWEMSDCNKYTPGLCVQYTTKEYNTLTRSVFYYVDTTHTCNKQLKATGIQLKISFPFLLYLWIENLFTLEKKITTTRRL